MKPAGRDIAVPSALVVAGQLGLSITISGLPMEPHPFDWAGVTVVVAGYLLAIANVIRAYTAGGGGPVPASEPACSRCGYCLTGNVSGVCPECGTRVGKLG
jgi:hypothetical protein